MGPKDVKQLRDKLGITQSELAKRLDVSKRTVEGWEQGARGIGAVSFKKLERLIAKKESQHGGLYDTPC